MQRLFLLFFIIAFLAGFYLFFVTNEKEKIDVKIEETVFPAFKAISVSKETDINNLQNVLAESYMDIVKLMSKSKLKQAAPVLAYYHQFSYKAIAFEPAIPVNKLPEEPTEGFNFLDNPECKVVLAHHYGSYESTEKTHELIDKWIAKNNKKIKGSPWEVYISDPSLEADTAKWYTQIYYPIE
jgi:effector-binding domain-containing protein